jgi:serine/threonine-protein kinase RsbW
VKLLASLSLAIQLKDLSIFRDFVKHELTALGVEPDTVYDLTLSVDELVTNILVHGYASVHTADDGNGFVRVDLYQDGHALQISVRDQAPLFDPNLVPAPDLTRPLEARPPGGLGVFLVKELVDQVIHRIPEEGGNEVILVKNHVFEKE